MRHRALATLTTLSLVGLGATATWAPAAGAAPVATTTAVTSTTAAGATTTTTPATHHRAKRHRKTVLTGVEIWRIVHLDHGVNCAHGAKELDRVKAATAAATTRADHWKSRQVSHAARANAPTNHKTAAAAAKRAGGRVRGFQKLASDGQALMRRIEQKCAISSSGA
jgi:hypothetical protein